MLYKMAVGFIIMSTDFTQLGCCACRVLLRLRVLKESMYMLLTVTSCKCSELCLNADLIVETLNNTHFLGSHGNTFQL
jgi:hypothetical protein